MKIAFEYTVADYKEANKAHRRSRRGGRWHGPWFLVIALGIFAALLMVHWSPANNPALSNVFADLILPILPWAFLIPILFWFVRSQASVPKRRFIDLTRNMNPWVDRVGWTVAAIVVVIFVAIVVWPEKSTSTTQPTGQTQVISIVLPLLPWVGLSVFLSLVFRGAVRRAWKMQPAMQRPKTFEYSPEQISIADELTAMAYRWPAVVRCVEAPNLFSLYVSEMSFHMVPKRAFPSPEAVDGFRRLVVEWADGQSAGFPVIQPMSQKI